MPVQTAYAVPTGRVADGQAEQRRLTAIAPTVATLGHEARETRPCT